MKKQDRESVNLNSRLSWATFSMPKQERYDEILKPAEAIANVNNALLRHDGA